jgi:predicted ATPase/DNA-binding CsgD family transcriptional regulator
VDDEGRLHASGALIGRDRELRSLANAIGPGRVVTVTGLGGTGKTTLATALADAERRAGRHATVVDVAPVSTVDRLLPAIATSLAVRDDSDADLEQAVVESLDRRTGLLVLDNLEHLERAGPLVGRLADRSPRTRFVVTSRVALGIPGEHEHPLGPLPVPAPGEAPGTAPAGALFLRRAGAPDGHWAADDLEAIGAICRQLDGIPLALEMAAAWTSVLTPRAISRRLHQGRLELAGQTARHDRMDRVIEASLDLLDPTTRDSFARLGVFAGSFDEAAASPVLERGDALGALRALRRVGLVHAWADGDGEPLFRLLEPVRAVAVRALADAAGERRARDAHAHHYAAVAEAAANRLRERTFADAAALERLVHANVAAAYDHAMAVGDGVLATRIATAMASATIRTGSLRDGIRRLAAAMAIADLSDRLRADAGNALVSMRSTLGEEDLVDEARAVVEAARASGDARTVARTLVTLGNQQGAAGIQTLRDAQALAAREGYAWIEAVAALNIGYTWIEVDERDEAAEAMRRASEAFARTDDAVGRAFALSALGEVLIAQGRLPEASDAFESALPTLRADAPRQLWIMDLVGLAIIRAVDGERAEALALMEEIAVIAADAEAAMVGTALALVATILLAETQPVIAARARGGVAESTVPPGYRAHLEAATASFERSLGSGRAARERRDGARQSTATRVTEVRRALAVERSGELRRLAGAYEALTRRELEVAQLLAEGRSDPEIAGSLGIGVKTASVHVSNVKAKLGVSTRVEAALLARRLLDAATPADMATSGS